MLAPRAARSSPDGPGSRSVRAGRRRRRAGRFLVGEPLFERGSQVPARRAVADRGRGDGAGRVRPGPRGSLRDLGAPSGPATWSTRCCGTAACGAASGGGSRTRRSRSPAPPASAARAPRPDGSRHLHRRSGDGARLRRRGLGQRGGGRDPPLDPHRRRRRPRAAGERLDAEAYRRANSTYVPGAVEPMLPEALSGDACSLAPGVERLAVTAEIELSAQGEPRSARFYRSRIRSDARLDYEQLDRVFAGREAAPAGVGGPLALARRAAAALAERRPGSALEISSSRARVQLRRRAGGGRPLRSSRPRRTA